MTTVTIRGLQEAQRWNARAIANMRPYGKFGGMLRDIISQIHRYEISVTHVGKYMRAGAWRGGGSLRASIRMEVQGLQAKTYLDPNAVNPLTNQKPSVYGVFENARGGEHAFADRTVKEAAPRIVSIAVSYFGNSLT